MTEDRVNQQREDLHSKSSPFRDDDDKSDLANDFNAMKHHNRKKRSAKVLHFLEKTVPELEDKRFSIQEFNANSFRITDGIKTVDFYPSSGRFFTNDKKWMTVTGNLTEFITKHLNT